MDRVLSAQAWVWAEGVDFLPQGTELSVPKQVAQAVAAHRREAILLTGEVLRLVVVAAGSRARVRPEIVEVRGCAQPIFQAVGLVTTAREPKLEGHLLRERGDKDDRRWVFVVGIDGIPLVLSMGLFTDPVLDVAGFISVPADQARQRRKDILGFGG